MPRPWGKRFVGAHMLLLEPGMQNGSWDNIPSSWNSIRFEAIDVLFISPFFVKADDYSLMLGRATDGGSLLERFKWVIRAARSKNPNVKIILKQFYGTCPGASVYDIIHTNTNSIDKYATSVAGFIESYYNMTLDAINGTGKVAARIDGLDVDVEDTTMVDGLPDILTAMRGTLDQLGSKLGGANFLSPSRPLGAIS